MLGIRSSRDQVSLRTSLKVELTGKPGCRDSLADVDRVKAPGSRAAGTGQPPASALIVLWMGPVEMHNDERVTRPGKWTEMPLRTRPFCPPDPSARRHDATDEDAQHGCHVVPRPPRGADGLTGLVACLGTVAAPNPKWISNVRDGIQMESGFKAVARCRHGILPHACCRQHLSRLAKPRYWVGNREHASGVQGGWCWRHS